MLSGVLAKVDVVADMERSKDNHEFISIGTGKKNTWHMHQLLALQERESFLPAARARACTL
jgi:hypothetical protein